MSDLTKFIALNLVYAKDRVQKRKQSKSSVSVYVKEEEEHEEEVLCEIVY